jgi:hypothetical protein
MIRHDIVNRRKVDAIHLVTLSRRRPHAQKAHAGIMHVRPPNHGRSADTGSTPPLALVPGLRSVQAFKSTHRGATIVTPRFLAESPRTGLGGLPPWPTETPLTWHVGPDGRRHTAKTDSPNDPKPWHKSGTSQNPLR